MVGQSSPQINRAAQLAPSYAPLLNRNNLLGASLGGLLIDPVHNLQYVDGGAQWGGVAPMALIGMARGHGLDLTPYLNGTGLTNYNALQTASLYGELKQYQGLHWEDWLLPQYLADWNNYLVTGTFSAEFNQYAIVANAEDLGTMPAPTIPIHFVQGNNGTAANKNGSTRPGDGVMLADDARTLVKQFCDQGTQVNYHEVALNHAGAAAVWAAETAVFVAKRLARLPIITTCNSIPTGGTSLTPIPLTSGS